MPKRPYHEGTFQLRADLWRVPLALSTATLLLFLITVRVDGAAARGTLTLPAWLSIGGAEDARAILGAMLGAVSTVLALIFSVALLVLSMAVSQFGPRILYRFVRDGVTQLTIGLFVASFVHTLLTFVVTRQEAHHQFVPQLTLVCSVALVILSFGFLIVFSHRTATTIQTQNVVAHIVADLHEALAERAAAARLHAVLGSTPEAVATIDALVACCAADGGVVRAWRTGFVQELDLEGLLATADGADVVLRLMYRPGQFVLEDAPLCLVLPAARAADVTPALRRTIKIGTHRTLHQDFEFGIAQLVEIGLRALSPAVNDTFTGLTCIDWLGDAIRTIHASPSPRGALVGASGVIRFLWSPPHFERLVKGSFDQLRQAGAGNPAVQIRLFQTFAQLAIHVEDAPSRATLAWQADAVWEAVASSTYVNADRADLEATYRTACDALGAGATRSSPVPAGTSRPPDVP